MGMINFQKALVAAALMTNQTIANEDGKCYALTLSGGGSEGAWEAGVIWGLVNYGNIEDFEWEMVSGISAGAINTAGLIGFHPKDGVKNAQFLSDQWASIKNSDIMQLWGGATPTW